ncbi:PREDICTED: uncharacterized protein LOC104718292 [Camelina sativa]|uniref:Uncharacterized protein LOC104718292 n=1 Tax=Camelina sativa TaxID=90675 RepID=A0ABM0U148_CAMSA|nr:PREDICTED: uncharacterized protein LOC104718292 [Camelina sativa]
MKTSMSIVIIFFVTFLSIITISLAKQSPLEDCIRRNIARSLPPSPMNKPKTPPSDAMEDNICRDEGRIIVYYVKVNGKFPQYYVKALCNVFGDDDGKVKQYVLEKWLNHSKKLIDSLSCASL